MAKTEFGEQQLRDLVNSSLIMFGASAHKVQLCPFSPTPHKEKWLGWDTGFYIPGLGIGHSGHYGCNLFIQYKTSQPFTGRWGQFGSYWNYHDYFMFSFAHKVKRHYDFHQQHRLLDLANHGFTVVYVTNHVWRLVDLIGLYSTNSLLTDLPVLRVSETIRDHKKATFTNSHRYFQLHSDTYKVGKINLTSAITETRATGYKQDIENVKAFISRNSGGEVMRIDKYEEILEAFQELHAKKERYEGLIFDEESIEGLALRYYLRYFLNLQWFRIQRDQYE